MRLEIEVVVIASLAAAAILVGCSDDSGSPTALARTATDPSPVSTVVSRSPVDVHNAPAALASSGIAQVKLAVSSFCQGGACADSVTIVTTAEALPVSPEGRIQVIATTTDRVATVQVQVIPRSEPTETRPNGTLAWAPSFDQRIDLPATIGNSGLEFDAGLQRGRYVVDLFVQFVSGATVGYGFLLDVQ